MKVLMFGWEFPPHNSGGLGTACFGLTKALAHAGIDLTFVLPRELDVQADFLKLVFANAAKPVSLRAVNSLLTPYLTEKGYWQLRRMRAGDFYGGNLFEEVWRYALAARDIAKEEPHDVIHVHDWLSFPAGLEAQEISHKPLVAHIHATEFDRTGGNSINHQVYAIEREGVHRADQVIAVSNYTKNTLVSKYGVPAEKIQVVHNGVDGAACTGTSSYANLYKFREMGYKIVLFVGRLTLQKGPDYFLKAAKKVIGYEEKVIFVIAGSGDMERRIVEEAAWLGISDKVLFTGFLRDEALWSLYRVADILVMPSVSEPFGITPLESLLNRTAVLISKQSGVSEVITHALKTDFWDTDEMANKIIAVLAHQPLKECLEDNGMRDAQKLTWAEAARKCIDTYVTALTVKQYA